MKRLYVLAAFIIVVSFAVPSHQLSAQPFGAPGEVATAEQSMTHDATQYAQQFNVSIDEARRRLQLQPVIGALNAAMTEQESAVFGGMWIQHQPEFRVIALMTQPDIGVVKKYVSDPTIWNLVDVRRGQHTLHELEQARAQAEQLAHVLRTEAHTRIDVQGNSTELWLLTPTTFSQKVSEARLHLPALVKLVAVPAMPKLTYSEYYGGMGLTPGCTTGFSVRRASTGETGVTTAGHCSDSVSVVASGRPYAYTGSLTFKWQYNPVGVTDIQWHTQAGVTARAFIYDGTSTYRAIYGFTRRISQTPGMYVCKYGNKTFNTCGTIITNTFDGANVEVNMYPHVDVGDSGGPWCVGNTAYGTTISYTVNNSTSVYGPVDQIIDKLGVDILTN